VTAEISSALVILKYNQPLPLTLPPKKTTFRFSAQGFHVTRIISTPGHELLHPMQRHDDIV